MGRPPRRTPRHRGLGAQWLRLPRWVRFLASWGTAIGALAGAIVACAKSWEYLEPYWFATHAYVGEQLDTVTTDMKAADSRTNFTLRDMQIDFAKGKLESTANEIAKWQLELGKQDNNETAKNLINDRLRSLTDTRENLNRQIRSIERAKAAEH